MTTTQLNARIDKNLKASGDAALALIGLTPSQAVRALWKKASLRGKDLEEVSGLLMPNTHAQQAGKANSMDDDPVATGWGFMKDAYAALGIDTSEIRDFSDDELLEDALLERFAERGLS